jgi:hypothetical protein
MTDYSALRAVTRTLQAMLRSTITNSTDLALKNTDIDLRTPKEMQSANNPISGVSLWLYRVMRNGDLQNHPPTRVSSNQLAVQPLPLDLYYLVTPIMRDPGAEQILLGRIMQTFNDHAIVGGADLLDALAGSSVHLRVTLEALTLQELTQVWYALQEPYRLSVSYHVQAVNIDADLAPVQVAPVLVRDAAFDQILAVN